MLVFEAAGELAYIIMSFLENKTKFRVTAKHTNHTFEKMSNLVKYFIKIIVNQ